MKGLILSGGKGTRLRPLTFTRAKQLVPVANKPVLFYGIEALVSAGITDIGIIVGETRDEIMEAVGDGSRFGCRVTFISQDKPLGLAHAVLTAKDYLQDSPFVMYLGDNIIFASLKDFVDEFIRTGADAEILLAHVPNPSSFGVAELDGDRVVQLCEKPAEPKSDLALVGVYLFTPAIFDAGENIKPSARSELEITDAIQYLIDHDKTVHPHVIRGWWKDTGKAEDMLEANRMVLDHMMVEQNLATLKGQSRVEGKVSLARGVVLEDSVVRGPAIIGEDVHLKQAFIGPYTALASGCRVENSEIGNSIILDNSLLIHIGRVEGSLIGHEVEIVENSSKPVAHRFVVGDRAIIEVPR